MSKKKRIPLSNGAGGLQNPFADLEMEGLAPGPAAPAPETEASAPEAGLRRVVLRKETARRGGKTVTVVTGFDPVPTEQRLRELAREIRLACGCGGTVRNGEIELQGAQFENARAYFSRQGCRVDGER